MNRDTHHISNVKALHYLNEYNIINLNKNNMWNKCNVVMLPTKEKTDILLTHNGLFCTKHATMFLTLDKNYKHQHLYITSDEEIKEDDWYIDDCNEVRQSTTSDKEYWSVRKDYKKIIATTNSSLGLPLIPQQFINAFIEQYNEGNVIKEVEVEYRRWTEFSGNHSITPTIDILTVTSDNTINIKQVKDSWSRKEVIELLHKYESDMTYFGRDSYYKGCFPKVTDDWANENL